MDDASVSSTIRELQTHLVAENAEQAEEYLIHAVDLLFRLLSLKINSSKTGTRSAAASQFPAGTQRFRETLNEMDSARNLIARGDWEGARAAASRGLTIWEQQEA